jgi:hypothetical protein
MKHRPTVLAAGAFAAACLLASCGSSSTSTSSSSTTAAGSPTTTAAGGSTGTTAGGGGASTTTAKSGGGTTAAVNPCEKLTAAAFGEATGKTVTAKLDDLTNACDYKEKEKSIALLTTLPASGGAGAEALIKGFLTAPPPGATFTEVDAGDKAVVAGPPEGRMVVIVGDTGYDLTGSSLTTEQLTALAEAIAEA